MYTNYVFDGLSDIYTLCMATVLLSVIIAFYFSNFLRDDEKEAEMADEESDELDGDDQEVEDSSHDDPSEDHTDDAEDEQDEDLVDYSNNSMDSDSDDSAQGDGLVAKLKSARLKELESQLTTDQLEEEKRIEREQLAAIYELLKKQEAELNLREIDENELNAQLSLYR